MKNQLRLEIEKKKTNIFKKYIGKKKFIEKNFFSSFFGSD